MASRTRLYIGNISHTNESTDLEAIFKAYGPIKDFSRKDKFAFVEFHDADNASKVESAAQSNDGLMYHGQKLRVEFAKERARTEDRRGRCFRCGEAGHIARDCDYHSRRYSEHATDHSYQFPLFIHTNFPSFSFIVKRSVNSYCNQTRKQLCSLIDVAG